MPATADARKRGSATRSVEITGARGMEGGIPFVDILFFAMVAAFLVLRLRSVLGRRTGHERPRNSGIGPRPADASGRKDSPDNVVALPDRGKAGTTVRPDSPLAAPLAQIAAADPDFDESRFLQGARAAFEMVVTAFANGDRDTLRPLTSGEVFANLERAMRERETAGHTFDSTLVGIKDAEIVDAEMDGREARISVRFISEQVNVTRDAQGQVVGGSTSAVEDVTDFWTFARDTRSRDPNWLLVATRAPSE